MKFCNVVIAIWSLASLATSLDTSRCWNALGMESGSIKDDDISASSSFDGASVGPHNARVRIERNGGAWCPRQQATHQPRDWLQVDLRSEQVITAVETQGRFGNGQGQEYAEHYILEYWRDALAKWVRYKDHKGEEVIQGNLNTYTAEKRDLDPIIIARKIRFYPYSHHRRTVCMRVELYGCQWYEGIVSYSMPQGDQRGTGWQFYDSTYDGIWDGSLLRQGLGQLTDGKLGPDNFKNSYYSADKAQGWVGWRNDSRGGQPVEIIFEFDTTRDFTLVNLFVNNQFTKDIQIFSEVQVHFSIGGEIFPGEPIIYRPTEDRIFENSRNVSVKLLHRVGKFVKLRLFFASKWILISEVSFRSEPVTRNYSSETANSGPVTSVLSNKISVSGDDASSPRVDEEPADSDGQAYLAVIVGVLVAVSLLLAAAIFFMILRHRNRKNLGSPLPDKNGWTGTDINTQEPGKGPREQRDVTQYLLPPMNSQLLLNKVDIMNTAEDYQEPYQTLRFSPYGYSTLLIEGHDAAKPKTMRITSNDSYDYAVPDIGNAPLLRVQSRPQVSHGYPSKTEKDKDTLLSSSSSSKNSESAATKVADHTDLLTRIQHRAESLVIPEISRSDLKMLERISNGAFGTVYIAEAETVPDYGNSVPISTTTVAVKFLPTTCDKNKTEFYQEVRLLAALDHTNLSRVLGISTKEEPFCVVLEYLEYGDLNQFLRNRQFVPEPVAGNVSHINEDSLTFGSLLYIGRQVASGMRYLESLNFVHRDLATRNCLIGKGLRVKISDFGSDSEKYHEDYYRLEGQVLGLPIRWMAWESIIQGRYTTKSDVWSFAVTLWEILNLGRQRPHGDLTNDEVWENAHILASGDSSQSVTLAKPVHCTRDIYELMLECWRRVPTERPSFREIQLFLQRKNLGYSAV